MRFAALVRQEEYGFIWQQPQQLNKKNTVTVQVRIRRKRHSRPQSGYARKKCAGIRARQQSGRQNRLRAAHAERDEY